MKRGMKQELLAVIVAPAARRMQVSMTSLFCRLRSCGRYLPNARSCEIFERDFFANALLFHPIL